MNETVNVQNDPMEHELGGFLAPAQLAALIVVVLFLGWLTWQWGNHEQDKASRLGVQVAMLVNALEQRMVFDSNFSSFSGSGETIIEALHDSSCGGTAPQNYLPCGFSIESDLLERPISVMVQNDPGHPNYREAVMTIGRIGLRDKGVFLPKASLSGRVMMSAEDQHPQDTQYALNATVAYAQDIKTATITATIIANEVNGSIYLKIDGTNDMEGHLVFDAKKTPADNSIENVANINGNPKDNLSLSNGDNNIVLGTGSTSLNLTNAAFNAISMNSTGLYVNDPQDGQTGSNTIYLGNQSGTEGVSNVTVNDMRIKSMGDQTLTSLLNKMSGEGVPTTANFTVTNQEHPDLGIPLITGGKGASLVTVYTFLTFNNLGFLSHPATNIYVSLTHNGQIVQTQVVPRNYILYSATGLPEQSPFSLAFLVQGLPSNSSLSGYAIQMNSPFNCDNDHTCYAMVNGNVEAVITPY